METVNTPGLFYAASYWVSCGLVLYLIPRKRENHSFVLSMIFFLIVLSAMMYITDGISELFLPMMLIYIAMMYGLLRWNAKYEAQTTAYFTVHTFIIGELIASLGWQILYYLNLTNILWLSYGIYLLFLVPMISAIIYLFIRQFKQFNLSIMVNFQEMSAAIVIGIVIFSMSNLSYAIGSSIFSSSSDFSYEVFLIRTLFDFAGLAILNVYHFQLAQLQTRLEYEKIQQLFHMQHQNYQVLEQSIEMINQKYHDLKYQIATLRSGIDNQESLAYLDQMEKDIRMYEVQNDTGNKMLDTILTAKAIYCQKNDIDLMVVADGSLLSFMQNFDLSTMFGNMLDNAIESVQKIDIKEKRLIHLLIAKERGFVRIRLENTFEGSMQFDGDLPKTTKSDEFSHGYGLKSIKSIVNKYSGSMTIDINNEWFELRILFPITDSLKESV